MTVLSVDLVATDRTVWTGQAQRVVAPAAEGEVGILVGHSPLLCAMRAGTVRVTPTEGTPFEIAVTGGFLSVDGDHVTVVTDGASDSVAPVASH